MDAQHTLGWFRARCGHITGSNVGLLMKSGRTETFSETGKSYLYQVAAERAMNPVIIADDELFAEYIRQTEVTSKAIRWGNEQEAEARDLFAKITGRHIIEVGSCKHPTIPYFASSPDGFCYDKSSGIRSCLEIKCPNQATFMRYRNEICDNESLLRVKYEYYYQCMAHMMCTEASETFFIVYNPFQADQIHIVRIVPDERVFAEMERRVCLANEFIDKMIN